MAPMAPDPEATRAVRDLLERCVAAWQDEGPTAAEALLAAHPDLADAARQGLAALLRAGLLDDDDAEARDLPTTIGGYRVRALLGRGGMGAVFLAHDAAAGRDVAIKVVHPQLLWYGRARERFRREVRALARLDHRGIVAIHQFGEDAGVPFFVMEHVPGASLATVLAQVAGRAPATLTGRDLRAVLGAAATDAAAVHDAEPWWRVVVRLLAQVADALHYAHRRGVVHRDVKPSNVLIDGHGRARLVDFGLSRAAGEGELTRTRTTIGSEPYMAPEQSGDGGGDLDGRADVFALCATLYEALTLRPPFGSGGTATRDRIRDGDLVPPSRVVRGLPRDLDAVCAVALDAEPRRRHATAGAFADDLRAVLDGAPVLARPLGPLARLWRHARRRPVAATATAAAVLLAVGAPATVAWQQYQAGQRVRTALARAERNRDLALAAVERLSGRIAQSRLLELPETEHVCRQMLEDAIGLHEALLHEHPDDPRVRLEYASGKRRLADLRRWLGEHAAAARDAEAALAELRTLPAGHEIELAAALGIRARLAGMRGDRDAAARDLEEAVALLDGKLAEGGLEPARYAALQRAAAVHRIDLAGVAAQASDEATLAQRLEEALALLRELDADAPTLAAIGRTLAFETKAAVGRLDGARAARLGEAAVAAYESSLALDPSNWANAAARAMVRSDLGKIAYERRDRDAALALAAAAHDELAALSAQHPRVDWLRFNLHDAKLAHADALSLDGRDDEAATYLAEAVAGCRELATAHPDVRAYRQLLALALGSHATLLDDTERVARRQEFEEADALFTALLAEQPDDPTLWQQTVVTRMFLAEVARRDGDAAGEAARMDAALALLRERVAARRGSRKAVMRMLCAVLIDRADCAVRAQDVHGARGLVQEARELGATDAQIALRPILAAALAPPAQEPR